MVDKCTNTFKQAAARGMCWSHYGKWRAHGNVQGVLVNCPVCGDYFWGTSRMKFCGDTCNKEATSARHKNWAAENEDRVQEYGKQYYLDNRDHIKLRVRQYAIDNPEKILEHRRKWQRENRSKYKAYRAKSRLKLKDKIRERSVRLYWENREEFQQKMAQWAKDNPDAVRANKRRYKLRRKGWEEKANYKVTQRALQSILTQHGGKCAYCQKDISQGYHWDHVVPLSRGGGHSEGNLVPACPPCNTSKNNLYVTEWKQRNRIRDSVN